MDSPLKWAPVEPQIWEILSKNFEKFWSVPENGSFEIFNLKAARTVCLGLGLGSTMDDWLNVRQLPNPPKMGERTVNTKVTLLLGLFHWQIGKSLKQSSSRFEQMPRNWQLKPPKIGQYKPPAVEISLVGFKTSFLIEKRHGYARILIIFLRQIYTGRREK